MKHLGPDGIAGPSGNVLIFFMQALFLDVVVVLNTNIRNHGSGYINIYIIMFVCEVLSASKVLHLFYKKLTILINLLTLSWELNVLPSSCHLFCICFLHQNSTWWADTADARILSGA